MSKLPVLAALVIAPLLIVACRSSEKSARVGGDAATLKVTMQGLAADDHGHKDWIYELDGCLSGLNGSLGDADVVTFTAIGIQKGLAGCQLKVKLLQTSPAITFAGEQGLLYVALDMGITEDKTGALVATAGLKQMYQQNGASPSPSPTTAPAPNPATPTPTPSPTVAPTGDVNVNTSAGDCQPPKIYYTDTHECK